MRIRTQLIAAAVLAGIVTLLIAGGLVHVTHKAKAGLEEQAESQEVARQVANMLSLTNEFSVYGGERAAVQWRTRHAQLMATVDHAIQRHDPPAPELVALRRSIGELPALFNRLLEIGQSPATPLAQRRRDLLLERLLAETQGMVENRHRWAVAIGEVQQQDHRLYTVMVLSAPTALLALLLTLCVLVSRRVLHPLAQLKAAVTAMQAGDLDVRCDHNAQDELGDAARAVDAMARALQRQSAALGASEHRVRMITDNMPVLICHVDRWEVYRFTNQPYERVYGKPPGAFIGQSIETMLGPATRAALQPHIEAVLKGERREFEKRGVGQATDATFLVNYIPDFSDDGAVEGFYVMTQDITQRKEAELRRAASERLLIAITDNIPALVAYIDRDFCYRFANARYHEWLGVEPRAMIGRHVSDAVSVEFFESVKAQGTAALAGQRVRWERHAERDGKDAHFLCDFIPDIGASGQVNGFYALTIDITDRRQAELAVAHSERRLYDLINNIPAMVGYFDMAEHCLYANDAGLQSLEMQAERVPGITLREALGEANYAQHAPYVVQVLQGQRSRFQTTGRTPSGAREGHFQAHLIPDRVDPQTPQRGFYLMSFDITALKQAQQEQALVGRQLRDITDNLPVLIAYIDKHERHVFLNATSAQWLGGGGAESLMGRTVAETLPAAEYERRSAFLREALAGQRVEFDLDGVVFMGQPRVLHNVYVPDVQPDGTVAGLYALSTDVTEIKLVERQLSQLAHADALTGLPNRRQFEARLVEGISRASRDAKPIAVMFLDVDNFKHINDRFGHATGDGVLREFATRLKASVRITDTAARLAGDEFVVLLEGLNSRTDAEQVAEKIIAAIRPPFWIHGVEHRVTTSLGVAFCMRPGPDSPLVDCADEALYEAKAAGRDTFRLKALDPVVTEYRAG